VSGALLVEAVVSNSSTAASGAYRRIVQPTLHASWPMSIPVDSATIECFLACRLALHNCVCVSSVLISFVVYVRHGSPALADYRETVTEAAAFDINLYFKILDVRLNKWLK